MPFGLLIKEVAFLRSLFSYMSRRTYIFGEWCNMSIGNYRDDATNLNWLLYLEWGDIDLLPKVIRSLNMKELFQRSPGGWLVY